jgi:hypothetical protein
VVSTTIDCLYLHLLRAFQDIIPTAKQDISRHQVAECLVVATIVVVADKVSYSSFKLAGKLTEFKRFHGIEDARYWGLAKMAIQLTMTAIACNLKRIVKLLLHQGCLGTSKPVSFYQEITVPILG